MYGPEPTTRSFASGFSSFTYGNALIRVARFFSGDTRPTWRTTSCPFSPQWLRTLYPFSPGWNFCASIPVGITPLIRARGARVWTSPRIALVGTTTPSQWFRNTRRYSRRPGPRGGRFRRRGGENGIASGPRVRSAWTLARRDAQAHQALSIASA